MNKEKKNQIEELPCGCGVQDEGLFVSSRHLVAMIFGLFLVMLLLFCAAYFLGKKQAVKEQDVLLERHYASDEFECPLDINAVQDQEALPRVHVVANQMDSNMAQEDTVDQIGFYGELMGFAKQQAADEFVKKLASRGFTGLIKKRLGQTIKGKPTYWFQVVTETFTDREQVVTLVEKIVKEERLKSTRIVAYTDQKIS